MVAFRGRRARRVFIIGAGMSRECGAPLRGEFLTPPFFNLASPQAQALVNEFLARFDDQSHARVFEELWWRVDEAITRGQELVGYAPRDLPKIRSALLTVLTEVLSAVHRQVEHAVHLYGLLSYESPRSWTDVELARLWFEDRDAWMQAFLDTSRCSEDTRAFLRLIIGCKNTTEYENVVAAYLSRHGVRAPDRGAKYLARLLFGEARPPYPGLRAGEYLPARFYNKLAAFKARYLYPAGLDPRDYLALNYVFWRLHQRRHIVPEVAKRAEGWIHTYCKLFQALQNGDTIITFNYDLFPELGLLVTDSHLHRNIDWGTKVSTIPLSHRRYGLFQPIEDPVLEAQMRVSSANRQSGESGRQRRASLRGQYQSELRHARKEALYPKVSVLKLHGSLNWAVCEGCGRLFAAELAPFPRVKQWLLEVARKTYPICCLELQPAPLVVPPAPHKDYDKTPLVHIWKRAEQCLTNTEEMVFLGYSLKGDEKLEDLVNRARFNRTGKSWHEIVVVDTNTEEVRQRYEDLFQGAGRVRLERKTCSQYLRTMVPL